jgi:hypothetical protein
MAGDASGASNHGASSSQQQSQDASREQPGRDALQRDGQQRQQGGQSDRRGRGAEPWLNDEPTPRRPRRDGSR